MSASFWRNFWPQALESRGCVVGAQLKRTILSTLILLMALTPLVFSAENAEMKIRISSGNTVLTATMLDNPTSRDFMSMLPLTLSFKDYAGAEKVSDLPRKLSTQGAPRGSDASVGDITLYAPWGNLAIFYKNFGYATGLIILGKIDSGVEKLAQLNGVVTIKRIN